MKKPTATKIKWIIIILFMVWGFSLFFRFGAYFDWFLMTLLSLMIYAND